MKSYLKDLEKELRKNNLKDDEIKEILADHEEMIESAMSDGLTDEELVEKFGEPEIVAKELSSFSEHDLEEEINNINETKDTLTFDNVKDNYLVNIKLTNEDVIINIKDQDIISVEFKGNIKLKDYEISFKNNELTIERKKNYSNNFFVSFKGRKFIVNLPKATKLTKIKTKLVNGDFKARQLALDVLEIKTTNGDLNVESVETKDFMLNSVNGDNLLDYINCNKISISSVNGDTILKNSVVKNDMKVSTVSGDIMLQSTECFETFLSTVSGDIAGKDFYPKELSYNSVSGDLKIVNTQGDRPIKLKKKRTLSGDIDIIIKQND